MKVAPIMREMRKKLVKIRVIRGREKEKSVKIRVIRGKKRQWRFVQFVARKRIVAEFEGRDDFVSQVLEWLGEHLAEVVQQSRGARESFCAEEPRGRRSKGR